MEHRDETAETQTKDKMQTLKAECKNDTGKTEEQGNKEIGQKSEGRDGEEGPQTLRMDPTGSAIKDWARSVMLERVALRRRPATLGRALASARACA